MPTLQPQFAQRSPIIDALLRQHPDRPQSIVGAVDRGLKPILAALMQRDERNALQEALGGIFEAPRGQGEAGGSPVQPAAISRGNLGLEPPTGLPPRSTPEGRVPRGPALDPNSPNALIARQLLSSGSPQAQALGQQLIIAQLTGTGENPETFGQPQTVLRDGEEVLAQFGNRGGVQPVTGFGPVPDEIAPGRPIPARVDGKDVFIERAQDGTFTVVPGVTPPERTALTEVNVGVTNDLGRAAQTEVEKDLLNTSELLPQLFQIQRDFDPIFQTLSGKLNAAFLAGKDILGLELDQSEQKFLGDITAFKADSFQVMSRILNQLSGAAISPAEAERLKAFLPDPGQGVFDLGDSPTEFKSKLDNFIQESRLAVARLNWLRSQGFNTPLRDDGTARIGLTEMPGIMQNRINEIEAEVRRANPGMSDDELRQRIMFQAGNEFGIGFGQ